MSLNRRKYVRGKQTQFEKLPEMDLRGVVVQVRKGRKWNRCWFIEKGTKTDDCTWEDHEFLLPNFKLEDNEVVTVSTGKPLKGVKLDSEDMLLL